MGRHKRTAPAVAYDPDSLGGQMQGWLKHLALHHYSPYTQHNRHTQIGRFIDWATERGIGRAQEVTRPVLLRYQQRLYLHRKRDGEPLSVNVQAQHLSALRQWFAWLTRQGQLLYNPAADLELPRKGCRLPRHVLSVTEVEQLLAVPDTATALGLRNRAILEVLYSTGMRRQELIKLTIHSLDIERGCLFIQQGKGNKDRLVPIGERAIRWLEKYRTEARDEFITDTAEQALFLGVEGYALSADTLTGVIGRLMRSADLGKRGSCHLLRHTMATLLLENGADIRHIQAILGHSQLSSTQLYTHLSIRQLKLVHERCHPGGRVRRTDGDEQEDA